MDLYKYHNVYFSSWLLVLIPRQVAWSVAMTVYNIFISSPVRPSVVVRRRPSSTISNMNISATSGPITTKFYLKHHSFGVKAALGFGPDRIRTLVSTATESSHRFIMKKTGSPLFSAVFHPILFILAGNDDMHESSDKFKFRPDWTTDCGVGCP